MLKIKVLIIFLVAFPLFSICQLNHFILKIHFDDPAIKTLFIGESYYYKYKPYNSAKIKSDSSNVNQNAYLFEGTTLYPTAIRMYSLDRSQQFNKLIFIDTGYQEITLIKKDSDYVILSNTTVEKEHRKFLNEMNIKTIDDKIDGEKLLSYVQKNPGSYVALFAIINQAFNYSYPPLFEKINNAFSEKIKETKAFQYYLNLYSDKVSTPFDPDFLGTSMKGEKITFSDLKGKGFVLMDFWASWCGPCRQMMPHLKYLYQKYHSKGLQIISISFDEDSTEWKETVRKEGMQSWINVIAKQNFSLEDNSEELDEYGVKVFPTTLIIDKEGSIIGRYEGYSKSDSKSDLDKKLKKIFK